MADQTDLTLYVYQPSHGLPSIDPNCLQILFYLRVNPYKNVRILTSSIGTSPHLPALEYDENILWAQELILKKLEALTGSPTDDLLCPKHKSRIMSYKVLTTILLEEICTVYFWGYEENSKYLIKVYSSEKYFPLNLVYANRFRSFTQVALLRMCRTNGIDLRTYRCQEKFENYLIYLSNLICNNRFILGDTPCTLDAHVCGYLAPILVLKFPNPMLQNSLKRYNIVYRYVRRFLDFYGNKTREDMAYDAMMKEFDNDCAPVCLIICAGTFAAMVMLGFSIMNGIIKLK